MDPAALLILTHLIAFVLGLALARWLTLRNLRVREVDGRLGIEVRPHDEGKHRG